MYRMSELLSDGDLGKALGGLPNWTRHEGALVRTAELADFAEAMKLVNRVADIAEDFGHHPDIDIRWNRVTFRCSTHVASGITDYDVTLAKKIDEAVDELAEK